MADIDSLKDGLRADEMTTTVEKFLPTPVRPTMWATLLLALVGPALTFVVLPPTLPLISSHFGETGQGAIVAELAQALPFLGLAIGGLAAGWIIRRLGSRRLLLLAAAIYCASGLAGLAAERQTLLLAGCFGIGVTGALLTSGLVALTGLIVDEKRRPRILGYQTAVSDFSTVTFGLVAAWITQSWGWHGPFAIYAGYGFLILLLGSLTLPKAAPAPIEVTGGLIETARQGWPAYLGAAFVFMITVTQTIQLPFHLAQHGLEAPASLAIVLTCSTSAATLGAFIFAVAYSRWGARKLRVVATVVAAIGFMGYAIWSGGLLAAAVPAVLVGLGIGLTVPSLFAAALHRAAPALRGHSIGLLNTSIFLGSFLSPIVFSPLSALLGYRVAFLIAACLVVLASGLSMVLVQRDDNV